MIYLRLLIRINLLIISFSLIKATYDCEKPNIEVAVCPNTKMIQVNWTLEPPSLNPGDWIGLYDGDIDLNNSSKNLQDSFDVTTAYGWVTSSKVKFDERITEDFKNPAVLKWRAVYWRKNGDSSLAVVKTQLSTFPNWMEHYWNIISMQQISEIFIPGTHDSVSDQNIPIDTDMKTKPPKNADLIKKIEDTYEKVKDKTVQELASNAGIAQFAMTQDQGILQQLLLGIRYLDIRVIYDEPSQQYWTGHAAIRIQKLDSVIDQVKQFVKNTNKEIVIFDIHNIISGVTSDNEHQAFIKYLQEKFTDTDGKKYWIPPESWLTNINDIFNNPNQGKVIISYNYDEIVSKYSDGILWTPIYQVWGNKQNIQDLINYFKNVFQSNQLPNNTCYSAMAQLTGTAGSVIEHSETGLSDQAADNASKIYELFMNKDIALKVNILATDFFMGMGTVRQAFIWNSRKFPQNSQPVGCDPPQSFVDNYYETCYNS